MVATLFLTVPEAAEILRCSAPSVYGMVAAKKLPAVRVGKGRGKIRIPKEAVENLGRPLPAPTKEEEGPPPTYPAPKTLPHSPQSLTQDPALRAGSLHVTDVTNRDGRCKSPVQSPKSKEGCQMPVAPVRR